MKTAGGVKKNLRLVLLKIGTRTTLAGRESDGVQRPSGGIVLVGLVIV